MSAGLLQQQQAAHGLMGSYGEKSPVPVMEWESSAECGELFAALAKAQGQIEAAAKDKENPHFRSRYADLASVWDACREPLSKNGLCVIQQPFTRGPLAGIRTQLGHSSGQWVACISTTTPRDQGPQAYGSCLTYLRRYALSAFAGVAPDDDDGEKAEGRDRGAKPPGANWGSKPTANKPADPADPGEPIDEPTLHNLRSVALAKFPKKPAEAKAWLRDHFGTDNPEKLTKFEAEKALKMLAA
jgi:hypothetical protein